MSEFIGTTGHFIIVPITITGYIWRSKWGADKPKLYLAVDDNGNIITFRSSARFDPGQEWVIEGKMKRHHIFNGQRQNHIANWALDIRPRKE